MDDIQRIDLGTSSSPSILSKLRSKLKIPRVPGGKKIWLLVLAVVVILSAVLVVPVTTAIASAKKTSNQAKVVLNAVKQQNVELADQELVKLNESLKQTEKDLNALFILNFIPILNNYYGDAKHLVKAGYPSVEAADILLESVKPYTDILGLKGQGSFTGGTAEQRIQTAVKTMGKVTPKIDDISEKLNRARAEIDNINPDDYPGFIAGGKLKEEITTLRTLTDQGTTFINDARPLIKILPQLLGEPKEKKYLVLFQNDGELRPTGGFLTAYAIFRIGGGIIHVDRSDDIYQLDATVRGKGPAPRPIKEYLPKVPVFHIRDSNLSPDYVESMNTFLEMYEKSSGPDVEGIIALDTHVLVSTIKILDDEVFAGGIRFTSKEDPRCGGCPQVIYELERLVSTPKSVDLKVTTLAAVQAQRKDIVGTLMYAIMEKALKSSPKLYWGPLFQDFVNKVAQKHILFYIFDKDAQKGLEGLNASGRIMDFEGDYLHINETNFGGAKANLFVDEDVTQKIEVKGDGVITKTITINYKNPHPPSDCNLERGALCINAPLRDWIRIYVPKGSKLVDSKGSEVKVITYDELGKTVFEGFLTVRPKGSATLTISYDLPFKLKRGSPLPLMIQKQPGTDNFPYEIYVNGKKTHEFPLLEDKTINLKI
jgi:type II secretory pathway pseudopilin PulG